MIQRPSFQVGAQSQDVFVLRRANRALWTETVEARLARYDQILQRYLPVRKRLPCGSERSNRIAHRQAMTRFPGRPTQPVISPSARLRGPGKSALLSFWPPIERCQLSQAPNYSRLTTPSRPPRLSGGFSDDDVLEELDGTGEAFVDAHQGVFVLDGDGAVVTSEAQLADQ